MDCGFVWTHIKPVRLFGCRNQLAILAIRCLKVYAGKLTPLKGKLNCKVNTIPRLTLPKYPSRHQSTSKRARACKQG